MRTDASRSRSATLLRGAIAALIATATVSGLAVAAKPGGGGGGGGGSTTWTVRLQGIGDSIMEGYNATCQGNVSLFDLFCYSGGDQPENSFFDGTSSAVVSLADRFISAGASTTYSKAAAQSGSEMVGGSNNFAAQAAAVVAASRKPVQVKVELGGNDICNRTSTGQMYTDATWRTAVRTGLDTLTNRLPDGSTVLLVGVPRVQDLYAAGVDKSAGNTRVNCESFWRTYDVCQIATRNDIYGGENLDARLLKVAERQARYNEILREEAASYNSRASQTRVEVVAETDGIYTADTPEVGNYSFNKDEINGGDCFHPSILGQNRVSTVVWGNDPNRTRR